MDRVRIGVIGNGRWGPNLIRNLCRHPQSCVVYISDTNAARLRGVPERYPGVAGTIDPEDIVRHPEIDAVVICTPTVSHYELARRVLEHGKHVFVEKPLAQTPEQCRTLIRLARRSNRVLFVGHVFVYDAGIQAVGQCIKRGDLGKIHYLQITRVNPGPVRRDVSALWDLASHDLSILLYWFGEMPVKVSAVGGRFISERFEDTVFATYTFRDGKLANMHVSWLDLRKARQIVIVGNSKMLVWDGTNLDNPIRICERPMSIDEMDGREPPDTLARPHPTIQEGQMFVPQIQLNEPLYAECDAFLKAIKSHDVSLSSGQHGEAVVRALVSTDESLREHGKEVQIGCPVTKALRRHDKRVVAQPFPP